MREGSGGSIPFLLEEPLQQGLMGLGHRMAHVGIFFEAHGTPQLLEFLELRPNIADARSPIAITVMYGDGEILEIFQWHAGPKGDEG